MKRFWSRHLDDVLIVSGAGLFVGGAATLSVTAALFTAGALLIAMGVLVGLGAGRKGGESQ